MQYKYTDHVVMRATGGLSIPVVVAARVTKRVLKLRRDRKRALRLVADYVIQNNQGRI